MKIKMEWRKNKTATATTKQNNIKKYNSNKKRKKEYILSKVNKIANSYSAHTHTHKLHPQKKNGEAILNHVCDYPAVKRNESVWKWIRKSNDTE